MRSFANCPVLACTWVYETSLPDHLNGILLGGALQHQERVIGEHLDSHTNTELAQAVAHWRDLAFVLIDTSPDKIPAWHKAWHTVRDYARDCEQNVQAHLTAFEIKQEHLAHVADGGEG